MQVQHTDVVIVGSGIVGMTLALLLARAGVQVTLVDKQPAHETLNKAAASHDHSCDSGHDSRVLALTLAAYRILKALAVWDRIDPGVYGHFTKMRVWEEQGQAALTFDSAEICAPVLGFIVPQSSLTQVLRHAVGNTATIKRLHAVTPVALDLSAEKKQLFLSNDTQLNAAVIVAADGSRSATRELAGIAVSVYDYQQTAISCQIETALAHECIARQTFLTTGPLAFLPLQHSHASAIVWSIDGNEAEALSGLNDDGFLAALETASADELGAIKHCTKRFSTPLYRRHATQYCLPGLVLTGDAAHSVHPLAGQGANLGLLDAAVLAQVLLEAKGKGRNMGSLKTLRKYERWRKSENTVMMLVLDGLKQLYANRHSPVSDMRHLGVRVVDSLPVIKHLVMRQATGLSGDLPDIAKLNKI